jgi:hypothetical protein
MRASNITRKFNVPPSYVLIHRVSTAGIGVLCQLECEGEFRAEVLKWIPGYLDPVPKSPAALEDPEPSDDPVTVDDFVATDGAESAEAGRA